MNKVKKVSKAKFGNWFSEAKKYPDNRKRVVQDDVFGSMLDSEIAKLKQIRKC